MAFDGSFQVLSYGFRLRTSVPEAAEAFTRVLGSFLTDLRPHDAVYEFRVQQNGRGPVYQILFDDEIVNETAAPERAFRYLLRHIFSTLIDRTDDYLLIHAGAVATKGRAIVMPGGPKVGKTSLAAALVEHGFDFLSDEYACLDATDSTVVPLPRALLMRLGDFEGFHGRMESHATEWLAGYRSIPADDLRHGAIGVSAPVGLVISPQHEPGAAADIRRISRSEAIVELGRNAFNFNRFNGSGIGILVGAVGDALCYRLTYSDLEAAVGAILQITDVTDLHRLSDSPKGNGAAAEVVAFPERLITAPTWGRLQSPLVSSGARVQRGDVIGHFKIDGLLIPLISHTNGRWLAWLAWEGERVPPGRVLGRMSVEALDVAGR